MSVEPHDYYPPRWADGDARKFGLPTVWADSTACPTCGLEPLVGYEAYPRRCADGHQWAAPPFGVPAVTAGGAQ